MPDDPHTEPLQEWNRIAVENTEADMVVSMLQSTFGATEPIETFSTWLLAGAAAVAAFMITNGERVLDLVGRYGFLTCGLLLCLSCLFGLLSKMYAVRVKVIEQSTRVAMDTFKKHLDAHVKEQDRIEKLAQVHGITLSSAVDMPRVIETFYECLNPLARFLAKRANKDGKPPRFKPYIMVLGTIQKQGLLAFGQALAVLIFLFAGILFAAFN